MISLPIKYALVIAAIVITFSVVMSVFVVAVMRRLYK